MISETKSTVVSKNIMKNLGWKHNRGTSIEGRKKDVLEMHFEVENKPSLQTITSLADSLQVQKGFLRMWFCNRRQEEKINKLNGAQKSRRTCSTIRFSAKQEFFNETTNEVKDHTRFAKKNNHHSTKLETGVLYRNNKLCRPHLHRQPETVTKFRFPERLIKRSKKIGNRSGIDVYAIPLIESTNYLSNFVRFSFGNFEELAEHRTILVMGNNSCSQAKFVNGIINFLFNVEKEDKFRFQLIDEDNFPKNNISVYEIYHAKGFRVNYSLTFVVTPYFDNSQNFEFFREQKTAEVFQKFLEEKNGINELDMICNVNNKQNNNHAVFSIFGKDVWKSIINWKTVNYFSDICSWEDSPLRFFVTLANMKKRSLSLTKQVLKERKQMKETINKLEMLLKVGHEKMGELQRTNLMVKFFEMQIECSCDAKHHSVIELTQKGKLPVGEARFKEFCSGCLENYSIGLNQPYPCISAKKISNFLSHRMKQRDDGEIKLIKLKYSDRIKLLQKELIQNGLDMLKLFQSTWRFIQRQNDISLNGSSFLTQRVFDSLFHAEQQLKRFGFQFKK